MARVRTLKPGFFKNEELAALPYETRLCFEGLWCWADREGRLEDRPKRLKAEIFPYDDVDMSRMLTALATAGFIRRYSVVGLAVIEVMEFKHHQKPHPKEPPSQLPEFTGDARTHDLSTATPDLFPAGSAGSSVRLCTSGSSGSSEVSTELPSVPAFLEFPVTGSTVKNWSLSEAQLLEWERLFPTLDVRAECRQALAWTLANPRKRKTASGMPAFLTRWLTTTVNSGKGIRRGPVGLSDTASYNLEASDEAERIILDNERRRTSGHRR